MKLATRLAFVLLIAIPTAATAQTPLPHPPAVAKPPGVALVEATESAKLLVCPGIDRKHTCEEDFDRLIVRARELASMAHAALLAERDGKPEVAKRVLQESAEMTEEFRRAVRAVLARYALPEV